MDKTSHTRCPPSWSTRGHTYTPPPCISYTNVHNYYGPYAYCSLDKGVLARNTYNYRHTRAPAMCAKIG